MIELHLEHPNLEGNPNTILTEQANAGTTSIKVANISAFSVNDFIVIGNLGSETTEVARISGFTGNDTINLASALKFSHFYSTPVVKTYYDQIEIYRAIEKGGPFTLIATVNIQFDEDYTTFRDTAGDFDLYYKIRYKNSFTNDVSAFSSALSGAGFKENSVRVLLEKAKKLFSRHSERIISRDIWLEFLNDGYREMINRIRTLNKDFGVKKTTIPLVANQDSYNLPSDFLSLRRIWISYNNNELPRPAHYLDLGIYDPSIHQFSEQRPFYRIEGTKIVIYPTPKQSQGQITIFYYYLPPKLAFDDDVLDESYIIPSQANIVIEYVLKRALELDKRFEEAAWYGQVFENRIELLLREYEERYKETTEIIPAWGSEINTDYPFF